MTFKQRVISGVETGTTLTAIAAFVVGMGWLANDPYEYGPPPTQTSK